MHEEKSATIGEKVGKGREISFESLESGEIEMSGMSGKPHRSIENTLSLSLESQAEVVVGGLEDELEEGKDPGHSAKNSECRAMVRDDVQHLAQMYCNHFLLLQIVP